MTRPRAPKSKSRGGGGTPTAAQAAVATAAAAGPTLQQELQQQQQTQQQQQQQQQQAAKKRPAEGGAPPTAAAAAVTVGEQPEVHQLERKRMQVAEELRTVEKQIFDLESNYFQVSSAMGNAIRGYEGFVGPTKKTAPPVLPEERLFSWSSATGQVGTGGDAGE
ncbi:hypothetical protein ABPG77_004990 [Micractinium sp. CCAP 211/92]